MATLDLITLDNVGEKLRPCRPDDENHLYAVIDIGSNGIRFSIASLAPPFSRLLTPIYASRAAISLFDALVPISTTNVNARGFTDATISSVSDALSGFYRLALAHGVPQSNMIILATEAMRKAANSASMAGAVSKATSGLRVHVLDPPVETLLGAVMGSRSGLSNVHGGALFLDLGGGSVQMTWVDTAQDNYEIEAALAGDSLPYGAAKLTRLLAEEDAQVQSSEVSKLQLGLRQQLKKLCGTFPALQAIMAAYEQGDQNALVDMYLCGGGFRGYGSMLMHADPIHPYPIPSIGTYTVDGARFKQTNAMRELNAKVDGNIFGMSKRRRRQFPAIATVVESVISAVPNIRRATFCSGSNREGSLMMKLPREVRDADPLQFLANVDENKRAVFAVLLEKLSAALPVGAAELPDAPTVLNSNLGLLFLQESWGRFGYDDSVNASYALHDATTCNPNCPGLTHLHRAILGLTLAARWGGSASPADAQLYHGLGGIVQRRSQNGLFWARYIGSVTAAFASMFPVLPRDPKRLDESLRVTSEFSQEAGKKPRIHLKVILDFETSSTINHDNVVDQIKAAAKQRNDTKAPIKISVSIIVNT